MPNLSPTMETGNIKSWSKEVGDSIAPGDVLCAIETDKATMDYEMQEEGYIAKVLFPAGEKDVPLGVALAILVENKEDIAAFANWVPQGSAPTPSAAPVEAAPSSTTQASQSSAPVRAAGERVFASPIARVTADAAGIAINSIAGTGPNGRILNADVHEAMDAAKNAPAAPVKAAPTATKATPAKVEAAPSGIYTDIENTNIRKVIAERLTYSK